MLHCLLSLKVVYFFITCNIVLSIDNVDSWRLSPVTFGYWCCNYSVWSTNILMWGHTLAASYYAGEV